MTQNGCFSLAAAFRLVFNEYFWKFIMKSYNGYIIVVVFLQNLDYFKVSLFKAIALKIFQKYSLNASLAAFTSTIFRLYSPRTTIANEYKDSQILFYHLNSKALFFPSTMQQCIWLGQHSYKKRDSDLTLSFVQLGKFSHSVII